MKKFTIMVIVLVMSLVATMGCGTRKETVSVKYPTKAITVIVPFSAGGAADLSMRSVADPMQKILGQPLVVMNKPGAGGAVGAAELVRSKADGYTIMNATIGNMTIAPYLSKVGYTYDNLQPVAQLIEVPIVLAVSKDSPIKNVKDFVEFAKQNPKKIRFGTPGTGSIQQLVMANFDLTQNIETTHMPFEGANPAMAALLGGHIEAVCLPSGEVTSQYKSGLVRILGVTTEKRFDVMPDAPTFKEQGFDVVSGVWYGIMAPKGLPAPLIKQLAEAYEKVLQDTAVVAAWKKLNIVPAYLGPEEFGAKVTKQAELHKRILIKLGLAK